MGLWTAFSAAVLAAAQPAAPANKAAIDAQCKAGQSAPAGKVGDWKGGLYDGKAGLTPATVPGATRVSAEELMCLDKAYGGQLVGLTPIEERENGIPGTWRVERGWEGGNFKDGAQVIVTRQLHYTLGTDLDRPMVVYCHSTYCFMSYNLALRAAQAGYRNIYWFRGGMEEWQRMGGKLVPLDPAIAALGDRANTAMMCTIYAAVLREVNAISEKQYVAFTDVQMRALTTAIPQPTLGEFYVHYLELMTESAEDTLQYYADLLKAKDKDAPKYRAERLSNYDKRCSALPGAQKGMF